MKKKTQLQKKKIRRFESSFSSISLFRLSRFPLQGRAGSPRIPPGGRGSDALAGRGLARQRERQRWEDGSIAFVVGVVGAAVVDGRHGDNDDDASSRSSPTSFRLPLPFSTPLSPLCHHQGRSDIPELAYRG